VKVELKLAYDNGFSISLKATGIAGASEIANKFPFGWVESDLTNTAG